MAPHDTLQARVHEPKYEVGWRHMTKAGEIVDVRIVSQPVTYHGRAAHFVVATTSLSDGGCRKPSSTAAGAFRRCSITRWTHFSW